MQLLLIDVGGLASLIAFCVGSGSGPLLRYFSPYVSAQPQVTLALTEVPRELHHSQEAVEIRN